MSETVAVHEQSRSISRPMALLHAMRPRQWVKNALVAAAPLASGRLDEGDVLVATIAAIACFCAASSGIYLLNDVRDIEADRLHPRKRYRPIAAGFVSTRTALWAAGVLYVVAIGGGFAIDVDFGWLIVGYLLLQFGYAFGLKHQPVFDIAIVASGFLLRAVGGGLATDIPLSEWFLMVAGFGSLFIVAGKRYSELIALGTESGTRRSLAGYTETYLRFIWSSAAAVTVTGYCLWAFSMPTDGSISWESISIVPFVLGILRYAIDVDAGEAGEPEDIVIRDHVLKLIGIVWLACVAIGTFSG